MAKKTTKQELINRELDEKIKILEKEVFVNGPFDYESAAKNREGLKKLVKLDKSKYRLENNYLKRKIKAFEKNRTLKIDGNFKEIRLMVSTVEEFIEWTLEDLIQKKFQSKANFRKRPDLVEVVLFRGEMLTPFFKELSFREKLNVTRGLKIINKKESKIISNFIEIRNIYSHPVGGFRLLNHTTGTGKHEILKRIWAAIKIGKKLTNRKVKGFSHKKK